MEEKIDNLENVFYDPSSSYRFKELNETSFIIKLFNELSLIMKENFLEYLFFVYSSHDSNKIPTSATIETKKKKVLIFISDESGEAPVHLSQHFNLIFKAYLPNNEFDVNNIFHFSLGCPKDVPQFPNVPINKRKYSIFFSGNLNNPRRELFFSLFSRPISILLRLLSRFSILQQKSLLVIRSNFDDKYKGSYLRFTSGFKKGISFDQYGEMIANSKIVLCPKGFTSTECFRHYEAMRAGCVIISEKLPTTHFYRNSPIVEIKDWYEGLKQASDLLSSPEEMEKLSALTRKWWIEKCSEGATANYIKSTILDFNRNENLNTTHVSKHLK